MLSPQESLLQHVRQVSQRVRIVYGRYLRQSDVIGIDYISIFTSDTAEYSERYLAAAALGNKVGEKRGDIFKLNDETRAALPTNLIRVCEPTEMQQLGCADIIPADYSVVRGQLITAGFNEVQKSLDGTEYGIIAVEAPDLGVSMYVPSLRIMRLIGIETEM